jgi:imidazolonepropionase-like amidohydrolase
MRILTFIVSLPLLAATNDTFLIRNVTVHPISGAEIKNTSVLVEDGKIKDIGEKITAAKGIKAIDGKGLHIYPGMIDSGTSVGMAEIPSVRETVDTGELGEFMPQLRALIAINPSSEHIPVVRANGISSVISLPGGGGGGGRGGGGGGQVIAGQAALVHLDGWTWEDMAVIRSAGMQVTFPSTNAGGGRGGGFSIDFLPADIAQQMESAQQDATRNYASRLRKLNEFFDESRHYQKAKAAREPGFKVDLRYEAMIPVLDGKTPLIVTANGERTIKEALAFAEKQKVRIVLARTREFGNTLPELKAKNVPVILGPTLALPDRQDDPYDDAFTLPGLVHKAGVKLAFATFNNEFTRNLPYQAANAVAYGLPYDEAIKALTLNPAQIWGVGDQLGSVEKGKWADLMVTDGDPLEATTQVKYLFIKGRQVDLSNKHTKLYEKYLARP